MVSLLSGRLVSLWPVASSQDGDHAVRRDPDGRSWHSFSCFWLCGLSIKYGKGSWQAKGLATGPGPANIYKAVFTPPIPLLLHSDYELSYMLRAKSRTDRL